LLQYNFVPRTGAGNLIELPVLEAPEGNKCAG